MKKANDSHTHQEQYPVLAEDGVNYVIKCAVPGCTRQIKITKAQFEKGGYQK